MKTKNKLAASLAKDNAAKNDRQSIVGSIMLCFHLISQDRKNKRIQKSKAKIRKAQLEGIRIPEVLPPSLIEQVRQVKLRNGRVGIRLNEIEVLTWTYSDYKVNWFANGDIQQSLFDAVDLTFPHATHDKVLAIIYKCEEIKRKHEESMMVPEPGSLFRKGVV